MLYRWIHLYQSGLGEETLMREHPEYGAIEAIMAVLAPLAFVLILVLFGQLGKFSFTTPFDDELTELILNR